MNKQEEKEVSQQLHHWKAGIGKESPYLGSWDMPGTFENLQLTIREVKKEMTKGLKDNSICNILYFVEKVKPMIVNATNAKMLRALSGSPFIENWPGLRIELRVERDLKAFGEVHDALRIVNKKIVVQKPVLNKDNPKFAEIVGKVRSGSTTSEIVSKYYELSEEFKEAIASV